MNIHRKSVSKKLKATSELGKGKNPPNLCTQKTAYSKSVCSVPGSFDKILWDGKPQRSLLHGKIIQSKRACQKLFDWNELEWTVRRKTKHFSRNFLSWDQTSGPAVSGNLRVPENVDIDSCQQIVKFWRNFKCENVASHFVQRCQCQRSRLIGAEFVLMAERLAWQVFSWDWYLFRHYIWCTQTFQTTENYFDTMMHRAHINGHRTWHEESVEDFLCSCAVKGFCNTDRDTARNWKAFLLFRFDCKFFFCITSPRRLSGAGDHSFTSIVSWVWDAIMW